MDLLPRCKIVTIGLQCPSYVLNSKILEWGPGFKTNPVCLAMDPFEGCAFI